VISELFARVEGFSVFIFLFMYYRDDEEQTKPLAPFFVYFFSAQLPHKKKEPEEREDDAFSVVDPRVAPSLFAFKQHR